MSDMNTDFSREERKESNCFSENKNNRSNCYDDIVDHIINLYKNKKKVKNDK